MKSIQQQDRQQAQRLKRNVKRLIQDQLHSINPWWLISFHYRDHHSKEDELLQDVADLKRKLHRIIYKSRDKTIKGAGEYSYPRMLFFHETSHQGTGQFHTHLILEKLPASLNTQYAMETLFHKRLPAKVKAHLVSMFKEETLFDRDKVVMRNDAMTERLNEIEALIVPTEIIVSSIEKELITNKVITNSTVNRNKDKRRAA